MRNSAVIRAELDAVEVVYSEAQDRRTALTRELNEALVAEASHPWEGKRVTRKVRRGYSGDTINRVGTVRLFDRRQHYFLRGLYPHPDQGDPIVVSDSGSSGYPLNVGSLRANETAWELSK